jgi:hypothetical protein
MSKRVIFFVLIISFVLAQHVSALSSSCDIGVKLINQDPYPIAPGDDFKAVFQVTGINDPTCGQVTFKLIEGFPFFLEPKEQGIRSINSGTYSTFEFKSFWIVPFKLIADKSALDGENTLRVSLTSTRWGEEIFQFNITIEDLIADFEVSIKDYESSTNTLTFEILNIGESDVEALTIEILKQENIEIKGNNRNIVGGLDSTEDTTFSFEAIPEDGEIKLIILYTDESNTRRMLEKTVVFDSTYFKGRVRDEKSTPFWVWGLVIIIIGITYWYWRKKKKKKHLSQHT